MLCQLHPGTSDLSSNLSIFILHLFNFDCFLGKYSCVDERKKYMDANILRTLWTRFFTKIFPVHEVHRQHPRYSLETLNRQMQDWLVLEAKQFSYQL